MACSGGLLNCTGLGIVLSRSSVTADEGQGNRLYQFFAFIAASFSERRPFR